MAKTWNNIPEKKVLATFKEKSTLKGTVSEKFDIYVDGAVPGGDGDVQGISMTIDPSTYVMTTQLKDSKGGNVGSPATVDLPLESMVVSGEYDEENKSIILTLSNGQTIEFSVADLVSGLQSEITPENPLSADLIEETSNKNFVTSEEKNDIDTIPGLTAEIDDVRQALDDKQDTIDGNNPLNADYIDDESSEKKLVTPEEKNAIETIASNDVNKYAEMGSEDHTVFTRNGLGDYQEITINFWNEHREPVGAAVHFGNGEEVELVNGQAGNVSGYADDTLKVNCPNLPAGTYHYDRNSGVTLYVDYADSYPIDKSGVFITGENGLNNKRVITFIPDDGSQAIVYEYDSNDNTVVENPLGGEAGKIHAITSDDINDGEYVNLWALGPGVYNCDPSTSVDVPLKIAYNSAGEVENVMTNAYGVWLVTGTSSLNTMYYFPAEDQSGQNTNYPVKYTITEGDVTDKLVIGEGGTGGENVIYFNTEGFGLLLDVENVAFYKDAQLTEEMTPAEMFQLTNKGPVNLIGMFDNGSEFIPWTSEIIVSSADDGMDGQGNSFFFRVVEGSSTGVISYYNDEWHNNDKVDFLTSSDIDGLLKKGSGAPTTSTTGEKGQLYEDTTNGKVYVCTNRSGNTTTWKELVKAGDNISTLNNDSGYQNASQVSSAIASAVGQITSFEYEVVQTLPATGEAGKIYLVANSGTTPNIYDEYIWVNNAFEKIGTTEMDLSNYYTKTQTDTLLGAKADQSTTYTKTEVDTALGNKADSSDVYTKTQVDTALGNKANSSDVYSKSEVNTALAGKQDAIDANHKLDADLIDNSTSDNKTYETGSGAPTTSTAGSVGELYVDKSTGTVYVCISDTGGTYTWEPVSGGSGPTVVQTTGQSTTSVMSQKAVTDAIDAVDGISITMTYTDPGEGSSLQANHFIAVYEA